MDDQSSQSLIEKMSYKFPVFSFSLTHATNKKYVWGLFFSMFIPVIAFILLLNFTETDFSGGFFYIWYYRIFFRISLFFLTSLVALLIGTGMFRDIISDDSVVYIMTKPIKRERIYFETYLAYIVITTILTTPAIILFHLTGDVASRMYDTSFSITYGQSLFNLGLELAAVYIVIIGLGAVFVTTGLWLKRPLLVNLLIAFGIIIEAFFLDLISNQFEPAYIGQNLVAKEIAGFDKNSDLYRQNLERNFTLGPDISAFDGVLNFFIILVLTMLLGYWVSRRKQFD